MSGGGDFDEHVECSIEAFTEDEQKAMIIQLTDYANFLIRTQAHWMSRGVLPRGYDAATLALEAIARVLDGRRRDWDPDKEPTITAYLKSVVKSIFSSEVLPAAKRELAEIPAIDSDGTDRTRNVPSPNPGPDAEMASSELEEQILESFELEEDQLVLMCMLDDVTAPAAIAEQTGLELREIYRIKQKIKRRLVGLREDG